MSWPSVKDAALKWSLGALLAWASWTLQQQQGQAQQIREAVADLRAAVAELRASSTATREQVAAMDTRHAADMARFENRISRLEANRWR